MSKFLKIDTSSPEAFMRSLKVRAEKITDEDFVSMHELTMGKGKPVPPSGKWGGIVICVGVAHKNGVVAIQNTNDPDKTRALFTEKEWEVFVAGVKAGKFD